MSAVEECIERIRVRPGVESYIIASKRGQVLRRFPTITADEAQKFSDILKILVFKGRSVVRDLDPRNELKFMRIRLKKREVIIAHDPMFYVIVVQKWTPAQGGI